MTKSHDLYRTSRGLYIIEAALEYFVSLLVSGAYLANLALDIGLSDSVTGVISSFVTLGCGFQLFSIFINSRRGVKRLVILASVINELLFAMLYITPFFSLPSGVKTAIFTACILTAHVIHQVFNSPKINWYMSLVDDRQRGVFTANKEIVSLIGGMFFTAVMGQVVDRFEAAGNLRGSFVVCGITLAALMVLHTLTFAFSKEKPSASDRAPSSVWQTVKELVKNRPYLKAVLVGVFWSVAHSVATPFYSTYLVKELGFSMTFISIIAALYAVMRALFPAFGDAMPIAAPLPT